MRLALILLAAALLAGCAGSPASPDGVWINQPAIDAAAEGGSLREALLAHGPNLEWQISSQRRVASYSNGFEIAEGQLSEPQPGQWQVDYPGEYREQLVLDDDELVQRQGSHWPEQRFVHPARQPAADAPVGSAFEAALYAAYLGGNWHIREGEGQGGLVLFHADGRLEGLPGAERYALCLAGDCASMSGEHDSLWLQLGQQGSPWLFVREGDELRIFQAVNRALPDEVPEYRPGNQAWLLERD
jgi:hypothetical protein